MLKINNLYTIAEDDNDKKILNGLNLEINPGEIHVIMGPNGSGKSTLANTILNNPRYIVTQGNIEFEGKDITNMRTNEIAKLGIFMSFQTPEEIPGITLAHFLKSTKKSITGEKQSIVELSKEISDNMNKLDMNKSYLNRDFNVGFSGGEKKKNEILQMLTYNPKLVILDETDSGLDVDAIKTVVKGISLYKNDSNAVLIITHSTKMLEGLKIDKVHVLVNGKIVESGDISLANYIDQNGYKKYLGDKHED
jgi:Fe-S cluster assembly ATP-binding protein